MHGLAATPHYPWFAVAVSQLPRLYLIGTLHTVAPIRADSRVLPSRLPQLLILSSPCSHDCEHGTFENVRHAMRLSALGYFAYIKITGCCEPEVEDPHELKRIVAGVIAGLGMFPRPLK